MSRAMITIALIFALHLMGGGNPAVAFTLRFGPAPVTDNSATFHGTSDADIPTPRMLNVIVRADGVTFGPAQPAPETLLTVPAVRVRSRAQPRAADEQPVPLARSLTKPRQLRGAELMLLRQAKQVAER
ncbi:MAG: hypothetical protein ETSY2_04300 [Candidatus Entotheonella gemina]|uniref:Uncharacterized protein n=1 Tax=Candidatus Entotheonella gemina TaxID=1429439 RepID=W4MG27_9BACT|nr:MAG: hypothetical protein ETSY2_04300 [Candidatus Entotheonella gemina]